MYIARLEAIFCGLLHFFSNNRRIMFDEICVWQVCTEPPCLNPVHIDVDTITVFHPVSQGLRDVISLGIIHIDHQCQMSYHSLPSTEVIGISSHHFLLFFFFLSGWVVVWDVMLLYMII